MSNKEIPLDKVLSQTDLRAINKHISQIALLRKNIMSVQKTLLILGNRAGELKYKSALAFLHLMLGNQVQYDTDQGQYALKPQFEKAKQIKELSFNIEEKFDYKVLILNLSYDQRVILLTCPETKDKNQQSISKCSFLIDQLIMHFKSTTQKIKIAVFTSKIKSFNDYEDLKKRKQVLQQETKFIKDLPSEYINYYLMVQKISQLKLQKFLSQNPKNYVVDQHVSPPCKSLQQIFKQSFFSVQQTKFTTCFRDEKKTEAISKMISNQTKNLQSYILTAIVPFFNQFSTILEKNDQQAKDRDENVSSPLNKQKKNTKFLQHINLQTSFSDILKSGDILKQFAEDQQLKNYLDFCEKETEITNVECNQNYKNNQKIQIWAKKLTKTQNIPPIVIKLYYLSQFVKICKYFEQKKFLFGSGQEQKVYLLKGCIKALCSLTHFVNSNQYITNQKLICPNLSQYYSLIESLIQQLMVLKNLFNYPLTVPDLMKSLMTVFLCSQQSILKEVLQHTISTEMPVQYYDMLMKIIEDNINSMTGRENGEQVFKSKCLSYRMEVLLKRCQNQILNLTNQEEDYETIRFLIKIYNNKEKVPRKRDNKEFDFKLILFKIAKLLQKTSHPDLAIQIYENLGRVLAYEDCLIESALMMEDGQQKWKHYIKHAEFFHKSHFSDKARKYCQIAIEGSEIQQTQNMAHEMFIKVCESKVQIKQTKELIKFTQNWVKDVESLKPAQEKWKRNFGFYVQNGIIKTGKRV